MLDLKLNQVFIIINDSARLFSKKFYRSVTDIFFERTAIVTTEILKIGPRVSRKCYPVQKISTIYSRSLKLPFNKDKAMKEHHNKQSEIER